MRLEQLELDLIWPPEITLLELRTWIKAQLLEYGEPLRWAITSIRSATVGSCYRELKVEAVLILIG